MGFTLRREAADFKPARIALFDIETAPNLGWVWGKWEQNVIDFKEHWYMLSFAYKWLGEKKIHYHALPHYKGYNKHPEDDERLCKDLWCVINQADLIIGHNGDRFDVRKSNARFITHGLKPPSPRQSFDTLKVARRHFAFDSNRLDDLGHYLGVGRKIPVTGKKDLWLRCMRRDPDAWNVMERYNIQDVALLERVYLKLRPWAKNHPHIGLITGQGHKVCRVCGSRKLTLHGRRSINGWQDAQCHDCGGWSKIR